MSALPTPDSPTIPPLQLADAQSTQTPASPGSEPVHPGLRSPLSDAHCDQLRQIRKLARPVERAAGYAKISGWLTLLAGAFSLPFSLGNPAMLVFCVVIAGIGTRELTLRRRLLTLETSTPRKLALNQLVLGLWLTLYSLYMLVLAPSSSMVVSAIETDPMLASTPELSSMLDDMAGLEQLAKAMLYVVLIVVAIFVQGGTAIYYACKAGALRRLHKRCPEWSVRVYQIMHAS